MKTAILILIITAILLAIIIPVKAQTSSENYIYSYDVMVTGVTSAELNNGVSDYTAIKTIQYIDGLGRPSQTVQKGFSYTNKDIIKPFEYNEAGIDTTNYLPYVGTNSDGSFKTNVKSNQAAFYSGIYGDAYGYAPTMIEKSPLQRTLKQGAPGESWQIKTGHPVTYQFLTNDNTSKLVVMNWTVADEGKCKLTGYYTKNELYVTMTMDEDSSAVYEFKDKQGKILLKRSELSSTSFADTYYIYDDYGLLRFVIPPEGSQKITGDFSSSDELVSQYVYVYKYDSRKRLIEKKIPGKDAEYFIYNKADQVVLYQDGNMRKFIEGKPVYEWSFTKYDGLGRVIISGITYQFPEETPDVIRDLVNHNDINFETIQYATVYPAVNNNYYTNNAFPQISLSDKLNIINYYDSYVISTSAGIKSIISESNMEFNPSEGSFTLLDAELKHTSGMKTVTFIGYNNTLWPTVYYYDIRGRLLQERTKNHRKGLDINSQNYVGLTDKISASEHKHSTIIGTKNYNQTEKYIFTYDAEKRLIQRDYYLKNVQKQKIIFSYSAMGDQVIKKEYYEGTTLRQTVDYQYNIRGWLTKINDPDNFTTSSDFFCMQLFYDHKLNTQVNGSPRFNGNISFIRWQSKPPLNVTDTELLGEKAYGFSYDKLNRLSGNSYYEYVAGKLTNTDAYQENVAEYDKNGNIKCLKRNGKSYASAITIDNLHYYYKGNQIVGVDDEVPKGYGYDFFDNGQYYYTAETPEYTYDANGNLTKDLNKGIINITYNEMNLPLVIDFKDNNRIEYTYDALGNKRTQSVTQTGAKTSTTDFISNFVYENNIPSYNTFDEGRIVYKTDSTWFVETYIKDHLGNVRVAYANDGVKDGIRQVNAYYPFGMNMKSLSANSTSILHRNEYLYNGKMIQDELGLNWLDYGARFYDPVVGRWWSEDLHAENYHSWSPYHYAANNPIIITDPTGMDWYQDEDGNTMWKKGSDAVDGYKNIGANYTQDMGGGTTVNYNQHSATSMTFTGAEESSWESQVTNGTNCYQASSQMLQNEGVETAGRGTEVLVTGTADNGRAGDANANASTGFAIVDQALENGNPIMVGVDYKDGSPNADGRTDHFIVVSSKTETLNNGAVTSKAYNYFDPRTSKQSYGTSPDNQLTISNNKMTGSYNQGRSNYQYTVTTVRRNR